MAQITPQEAASYLERWRQVNRHEVAELRRTPVGQKLKQLCALSASREAFPPDPDRGKQAADVAARWRRIRAHYGE
jgi:hypothetical protein